MCAAAVHGDDDDDDDDDVMTMTMTMMMTMMMIIIINLAQAVPLQPHARISIETGAS
jgi:hypothetical protein